MRANNPAPLDEPALTDIASRTTATRRRAVRDDPRALRRIPPWRDAERAFAATAAAELEARFDPPRPLTDVLADVLDDLDGRRDLTVRADALRLRDGVVTVGGETLRLRPLAARQLHRLAFAALDQPTPPWLDGELVRQGLARCGARPLTLRLEHDEVRAILGPTWVRFDDRQLLEGLSRAADAMGWDDLRARIVVRAERLTVVRATLARSRIEVRPGDWFERGVQIGNGEVGACAFRVTPMTWRQVCGNCTLAATPTLRLSHAGSPRRFRWDASAVLTAALAAGDALIRTWRDAPDAHVDAANALTFAAQARPLATRLAMERRAQALLTQDAPPA